MHEPLGDVAELVAPALTGPNEQSERFVAVTLRRSMRMPWARPMSLSGGDRPRHLGLPYELDSDSHEGAVRIALALCAPRESTERDG